MTEVYAVPMGWPAFFHTAITCPRESETVTTPCKTSRESELISSRQSIRYNFPMYLGNYPVHKHSILQSNMT